MKEHTSRRNVLKGLAGAATLLATEGAGAACSSGATGGAGGAASTVRIGYIAPSSGGAAAFGEPNEYVLKTVAEVVSGGITVAGRKIRVEIVARDSQSTRERAAALADELINREQVHLMLCSSTPETVNPVSDACETAKVPCLSTIVPWEAWYYGRGATDATPFTYTYHFFLGVDQYTTAYSSLWSGRVGTNRTVGVMWPDDTDGNVIREGLGPALRKAGFTVADPGGYSSGTTDFGRQISFLKQHHTEIFNSFPLAPDFVAFWTQARKAGYRPKIATVAKTCTFVTQVQQLGELGYGLSAGFWWTPEFPYTCTLTHQTGKELAAAYRRATGRQWAQSLGPNMALFEVAVNAFKRCSDPRDRAELAAVLGRTKLVTVAGPLDWTAGPVPNVAIQPVVMGQWRPPDEGTDAPPTPVIVDNAAFQEIPIGGDLLPYGG